MTPQELKNSILQLAIQGKLVEQNEKESAVDLAGIKERKTEPYSFKLPIGWVLAHLESITNSVPSKAYQILESEVIKEGQFPVISQSKSYSIGYCNKAEKLFQHDRPVVVFGDHTAEVKLVKFDFVVGADGVKIFEPFYKIITADFLFYVLQFYSKDLNKAGGYSRHYKYIKNKPIPIPPLAEQKRIVTKIKELLPYIDRYEQAWSRLEVFNARFPDDMRKSLLQLAIQGKLVEQRPEEGTGEKLYHQIQKEKQKLIKADKLKKVKPLPEITEKEKPFKLPDTWMWVRVGEVTQLNPRNDIANDLNTSFIPMALIADGYQSSYKTEIRQWRDIKKGFTHFAENDIGIAKITPCFQNRKSVVFDKLENGYGAGTTELSIVRVIDNLIERKYLLYFFKSAYFIDNGVKSFTGTAGQQRIHRDYLSKCMLPLPPLAEQKRIVERLEQLLPLCERLK